jgi:uncharacterized membrane protein
MIPLLVILVITFIFILGAGLAFLQIFNPKKAADGTRPDAQIKSAEKSEIKTKVRWSYFILPVIILLISVFITIYFYSKLPDTVTLRPDSDNSTGIGRSAAVLWAIVPQLLLTLISVVVTYGTTKISSLFRQASESGINLDTILMVMSNMVVIPQLVLIVAILNVFSYNSFGTHISFVWWVSLTIILAGIVFLSFFFVRVLQKMGKPAKK